MSQASGRPELSEVFAATLDFEIDEFQRCAMKSLDEGASVLVAAPTGSGKTLVAEYAITLARARRQRAFYTTPIKALSNQKYRDLVAAHGADEVGLVTGDNAVNPEAPIVVMTTEVLRNMIYASSNKLDDLGIVVLDEVHFLQDAYRGPVWEEVIIQLAMEVQLVCLSATVSNADEVANWLTTVRGRTDAVVEQRRPVELVNHFVLGDGATGTVTMYDTIVNGQSNGTVRRLLESTTSRVRTRRDGKSRRRFYAPSRPDLVELLDDENLVPAIVFIFSRAQCEDAVRSCDRAGLVLTEFDERQRIEEIIEEHCASLSDDDRDALNFHEFLEQARAGISCHHAGMIPMFKEAIEQCFVEGLIKVVFATETLAVGINMPARAVVIEKLTKYTGEHHALLRASEFAQLTGRAGRRGLDDIGHALTVWNPFVSFDQVVSLALSRSFRLSSAFRPTFNMAVNLVRTHSREGTHHILNLSFAQYQADKDVVSAEARLQSKRVELDRLLADLEQADEDVETGYADDLLRESDTQKEIAVRSFRPGDVALFDSAQLRGRGLVLATASRRGGVRLTVLTPTRKILEIRSTDCSSSPRRVGSVDLPVPYEPSRTEFQREAATRLTRVKIAEEEHVTASVDDIPTSFRDSRARRLARLQREIGQLESGNAGRVGSVSARFDDVVAILQSMDYIDGWSLTDKGELLCRIFHESDLLVAEVLTSGMLDKLSPIDLAAVLSCLVYEPRGGEDTGSVRWPNETVRNRFRRIEKILERIHSIQRSHAMTLYRLPDGGICEEVVQWASGRPLARILSPDLTPGDFVRTMRQLIDLLRQVSEASPHEDVRRAALDAVVLLDKGVVAASTGFAA